MEDLSLIHAICYMYGLEECGKEIEELAYNNMNL